jgi:hypothetical protein
MIAAAQAPIPERIARMITAVAGTVDAARGVSLGRMINAATSRAIASPQKIRNGASNEIRSAVTPPSAGPAIEPTPVARGRAPVPPRACPAGPYR